ncbi:nicotinate (nicotinamide) nucleotide adenylyltransferase [uncultured Brachyspira sp.]|uniref:nicotinate (nicotinamide) nucleotide adenylyltransferase n=1 Tax=uncultured Brachyspira sp. TaxID=221953 RepID=UPI0025DAEA37|nr:nicotinate (nicotinamide) nucleotide adenylyltransferase [uncultured Brachyspira sp.]
MKISILGGTFDPPHLGHLILADTVITNCGYDRVIFIPAKIPPHKNISGKVSNEDRLNMLKLSIEYDERFSLEEYELNNNGISYTINTISYLYDNYKNNIDGKIGLIIGADLIKDFHKWKYPEKISEISNIIAVNRENNDLYNDNVKKYNMKVITAPRIDISSSIIRNRIKEKKSFRYFMAKKAYDYILKKKLYL